MLTPIDIENKIFKTGIGYDRKDVDAFLIELQESYEKRIWNFGKRFKSYLSL